MSALIHWTPVGGWNPIKDMAEMENRLNSLFNLASTCRGGDCSGQKMTVAEWIPVVDISEDDKEYLIKVELPGITKEDIAVKVEQRVLAISGERKSEHEEKGRKYHRVERVYGRFERSFTLPEDADSSKVVAEYKDGVLKLHVTKAEKAQPKTIDVRMA